MCAVTSFRSTGTQPHTCCQLTPTTRIPGATRSTVWRKLQRRLSFTKMLWRSVTRFISIRISKLEMCNASGLIEIFCYDMADCLAYASGAWQSMVEDVREGLHYAVGGDESSTIWRNFLCPYFGGGEDFGALVVQVSSHTRQEGLHGGERRRTLSLRRSCRCPWLGSNDMPRTPFQAFRSGGNLLPEPMNSDEVTSLELWAIAVD